MLSRSTVIALLVFAALGLSGCTSILDREEAGVYAAYVDPTYTRVADSSEYLKRHVICDQTADMEMLRCWPKVLGHLSPAPMQETIDDFVARNGRRHVINPHLRFRLPHRLIPNASIDQFFAHDAAAGWLGFNKEYPKSHGILWLSRVGFNKDRNQALLYTGNEWTAAAGEGFLILLQKETGGWREVSRAVCWVS
jgi:hypothetical protein